MRCNASCVSTYERATEITDKRIPKGCTVTYHEIRGYDSPDRWYEARRGSTKLGEFGTKDQAIAACGPKPAVKKARGRG